MTDSGEFDARPVRAFLPGPDVRVDEPDAPLSFTACLGLAALLHDLVTAGSQLIVATHSPVLAAVPSANVLELGPWGIRPASWEDLSLVVAWRQFMRDPRAFFRHLI
jgi:predicted ATPase